MSRVAHSRTMSRMKNKPSKPDPKPPERKASARTAPEKATPRADEPREIVAPFRAANALREPEPKPVAKVDPRAKRSDTPGIHIKVNDQHFGPEDRLPKLMSAREIGALVGMPDAKVRWLTAPEGARNIPGRVELVDGAVFEAE